MGEFAWIAKYLKPLANSPGAMALANDVAVIGQAAEQTTIATMDTLVEGVHFLSADPLETVGRKLVRVNASDIICKGGRPAEAMLSVAVPEDFTEPMFEELCSGIGRELGELNISLLGGDTVRTSGPLTLSLTLLGRCPAAGPIPRSGAGPGDVVCVSGPIGRGHLGLRAALGVGDAKHVSLYRLPAIPDLSWIELIAEYATASIDISDGLIADAEHLSQESNVEIALVLDSVPWAASCATLEPMIRQATGGDDYQVLFTVSPSRLEALRLATANRGQSVHVIGRAGEGRGVRLSFKGTPVPLPAVKGYEH